MRMYQEHTFPYRGCVNLREHKQQKQTYPYGQVPCALSLYTYVTLGYVQRGILFNEHVN